MTTQPEALRLAERLKAGWGMALRDEAAAELRRLHAENEALIGALKGIAAIEDRPFGPDWEEITEARMIARAAIDAARSKT